MLPPHKDHKGHQDKPKALAISPYCELWICEDCDMVHFILGDISLRLSWSHIVGIANTLNLAVYESDATSLHSPAKTLSKRMIN